MPSAGRPQFRSEHSNFQSGAATDDAGELNRRNSNIIGEQESSSREPVNPYEPDTNASTPPPREHSLTKRLLRLHSHSDDGEANTTGRSSSGRRRSITEMLAQDPLALSNEAEDKKLNGDASTPRPGLVPRPIGKIIIDPDARKIFSFIEVSS